MVARVARLLILALLATSLFVALPDLAMASDGGPGMKGASAAQVADWKTDLAVYSFVVFIILMAILTKFAWKPISEALDKREANVANNIAAAQRAADEAKVML